MKVAKEGDTVKVHYTGKYTDGQIFDSSLNREPLQFDLGKGQMIQGFEQAVLGMGVGEDKTINISPESAYGQHREDMVFPVDRSEIPEHIDLQVGMQLNAQTQQGESIQVLVKEIQEDHVLLDANHPLAGENLIFEIKLLEITPAEEAGNRPLMFD
ncbi:MAG: peptidylprolyl isomerase [Bacteroidia bacterium]|nr:peptidylprolyl isomerase [Bacteroidia bacterium]